MRRFFLAATLGLVACTGTVSLGIIPRDENATDAGNDATNDTGADVATELPDVFTDASSQETAPIDAGNCPLGTTFLDDFESGILGLNVSGGANLGAFSLDTSHPISGSTSLAVTVQGVPTAPFAYFVYDQPTPTCRLTVAFELRPGAGLVADGANIAAIGSSVGWGAILHVDPGGTLSVVQDISAPSGPTVLATSPPVGQLVAGQVSTLILSVDLPTKTLALTVDGHAMSASLVSADDVPGLSDAEIGLTPPAPATSPGTYWIDNLYIGTDPSLVVDGGLPPYYDAAVLDSAVDAAPSFGACLPATAYSEGFEDGFPADVVFTDPGAMSIDTTNPIDGTASLKLTTPPQNPDGGRSVLSYLTLPQPANGPCALTLSFEIRPNQDLLTNGANLVVINGVSTTLTLVLGSDGSFSFNEIESNPERVTMAYHPPLAVPSLTAGQVSTIALTVDTQAKTASLTVDGETATQPISPFADTDPHLTNAIIGEAPTFFANYGGTYWIDDVTVQ